MQNYMRDNALERERLRALVAKLDDTAFSRPVGHGWTVSAALAHLSFWDRFALEWLEEWERLCIRNDNELTDWLASNRVETDNDDLLPQWLATKGEVAAREVLETADALDRSLEALDPALAQAVISVVRSRVGNRSWVVDRATHRREHIDEIERALEDSELS
jgi:hypothetical protein